MKTWKKVLKQLYFILNKEQKIYSILIFFLTIIGAFFSTLGVTMIIPFVQSLMYPEILMENKIIEAVMQIFDLNSVQQLIILISFALIVVYLVKNLYLGFLSYVRAKYQSKIFREISLQLMYGYMGRQYTFFLDNNSSRLTRGTKDDVNGVYTAIIQIFRIFSEIITSTLIVLFVIYTNKYMALAILLLVLASFSISNVTFSKKMKKYGENNIEYSSDAYKHLNQAYGGIKEIIVRKKQKYFADVYKVSMRGVTDALAGQNFAAECPMFITEALCVSGMIGMVAIQFLVGMSAKDIIPQMAAFAVAAFQILPSIGKITGSYNIIEFFEPTVESTYYNLKEVENAETILQLESGRENSQHSFEKLAIENVSWTYDGQKSILDNIKFTVRKGESVAIIGTSGAGKTTLIDVVLGLLKPQEGDILVDGQSIYNMPYEWSNMVGYVPQNIYLLDESIKKNIAFGIDESKINEERVWECIREAQLEEFVENLPLGIDTVVGERGVRFSGGQRQRIAVARALYYNPPIIVLDEATSALDTETEVALMEAIDRLRGMKTLIIVAHRLSTIKNCDRVYEIRSGSITEKVDCYTK